MDPLAEEQLDYGDDEFVGAQKLQYQGGGAISALADDDTMGEDDEYDDLYNDVNVGEGFLQLHRSEVPAAPVSFSNGVLHTQTADVQEPRSETGASQGAGIPGVSVEGRYSNSEGLYSDQQKSGIVAARAPEMGSVHESHAASMSQKGRVLGVGHDVQVQNMGLQGPAPLPQKTGVGPANISGKNANEPVPLLNTGPAGPRGPPQMPTNQTGINFHLNSSLASETPIQPPVDNGSTMLFVGELHWWTTDAELESVLSQYGRVKEIKFFDERASGKSKGYCQVEFYDSATAAACKEGMNGYVFNGRACVVAFASPQTLKQMGASYSNKSQAQNQPQTQGRRANDGAGRGNMNFQGGDSGRGYGRGGWGRGGQGVLNRGSGGGGPMRGRGSMGGKNMVGSNAGVGSSASGGGYGQGMAGPAFGGPGGSMMHPQGMMGGQFEPPYMGRGGGYGGFLGPTFPGMLPSFPAVNSMGLAGVAPHVNPAFFGRGMAANGMGMMGSTAMDGHQAGMWTDPSMGGWGGEEHGRGTRESSYGADDGGSEYGYGEAQHDKGVRSNATSREKDRGSERDWSGNMERRLREDKEQDWERSDREYRYRDERDGYRDHRQRERDSATENDRDRGQSSSRSRSRSRAVPEEDHRSRSRDVDYGKRRRLPSE